MHAWSASRLTLIPAGSVTAARAVLALPAGPVITVRSEGVRPAVIVAEIVGWNGSASQAVGVNGAAARVDLRAAHPARGELAVAGPHEVGSVMNGVAAPPGGLPSSVRFIDSIRMSCCPSSGIPTFGRQVRDDRVEAAVGAAQRDRRDDEHLVGAERRADDHAEPRRLARAGLEVVDVAVGGDRGAQQQRDRRLDRRGADLRRGRAVSAWNCAWLQRPVAFGLPTSPGGRLIVRSRGRAGGPVVRREADRDATFGASPPRARSA